MYKNVFLLLVMMSGMALSYLAGLESAPKMKPVKALGLYSSQDIYHVEGLYYKDDIRVFTESGYSNYSSTSDSLFNDWIGETLANESSMLNNDRLEWLFEYGDVWAELSPEGELTITILNTDTGGTPIKRTMNVRDVNSDGSVDYMYDN